MPRNTRNTQVIDGTSADESERTRSGCAPEPRAPGIPATATAAPPQDAAGTHTSINTENFLASVMESFARMQAETNRTLVETLRSLPYNGAWNSPASTPTPDSCMLGEHPSAGTGGNFSKCTTRFNGSSRDAEVLEAFIDAVQVFKKCAQVSDEHALRGLPMLFEGDAAVWWRGARAGTTAWTDAVTRLRAMYGAPQPAYKVLREIFATEQKNSERAEVFMCQVRSLIVKLPYAIPVCMQIDMIYGLLHRRIRKRLPRDNISDMDSFVEKARAIEDSICELSARTYSASPDGSALTKATTRESSQSHVRASRIFELEPSERGTTTGPRGTTGANLTSNSKENTKRDRRVRCSSCKFYGHGVTECRNLQSKSNKTQSVTVISDDGTNNTGPNPIRCYGYGQPGVVRSKCDICSGKNVPPRSIDFNIIVDDETTRVRSAPVPSQPTVSVIIANRIGVAILDTGASCSIAGSTLYSILRAEGTPFWETERTIGLADGSRQLKTVLAATVPVELEGRKVTTEFVVFPGENTRTLLGREFIAEAGVIMDMAQESWYFSDNTDQVFHFVQPVMTSPDLMQVEVSDVSLRSDEATALSPEQRNALNAFLRVKADQFATEGPPTDLTSHKIKVSDNQEPLASPPYRMSPLKKEALEKELQKLLAADVIEECESPWAANVVLVKKKDDRFRLCVDYRKLNAVTEPDRYPLPRIEDVLHAAKTSKYMTTLDLRSGYFQVSVDPDSRDLTSFTTPLGTFRFKRMPMGLRNSGVTFQRLIDRFKSNLPGVTLVAYLDDLLVLSEGSFERHLSDLEAVFNRLRMFNLRVNREKSCFARESVKFLGHVIVPGGIQVDPDKTSAIVNMLPPQNVKHLKCFLQTSSWFRRFIPSYAEISAPLTSLLRKGSTWKWGPDQQGAFETIKSLLVTVPILRQADDTKPFVLRTDSSGYALGAALLQGEGVDERPVEYASRLLTAAERNYNTTEREGLAVVWAVSKFRGYINGAEVIVKSDHSSAYLNFGREMRAPADVMSDMWAIVDSDNVVASITPFFRKLSTVLLDARDVHEKTQVAHKKYADENRRPAPDYKVGDLVLLKPQGSNDTSKGQTPKFIPRRDGPYRIQEVVGATMYALKRIGDGNPMGRYHVSLLTPFIGPIQRPVREKRKRGRPRKPNPAPGTLSLG